jgi:hypothetical protein
LLFTFVFWNLLTPFVQTLKHLLATNQQATANRQQIQNQGPPTNQQYNQQYTVAENMRQTTMTQAYDPPVGGPLPQAPNPGAGYRLIVIDGVKYLMNDTTNHLLVVPPAAAAPPSGLETAAPPPRPSQKAKRMIPVELAQESYSTPPGNKRKARHIVTNSSVVLSESRGSQEEVEYVGTQQRNKAKKPAPRPSSPLPEAEVAVPEQSDVDVEIDSQDLPRTGHFDESDYQTQPCGSVGSESDISQSQSENLLQDDDSATVYSVKTQ